MPLSYNTLAPRATFKIKIARGVNKVDFAVCQACAEGAAPLFGAAVCEGADFPGAVAR